MCKYNRGFTLVELVIVIAVIGILAGLAIPHFLDSQAKTRTARAAADMRTLQSAVEQYMAAGNTIDGLTAVSYTHLDVYKRQHFNFKKEYYSTYFCKYLIIFYFST